jgi:hypothetical protein
VKGSGEADDHFAAGRVCFHYAVRFPDLLEAEHTGGLRFEAAFRHLMGDVLKRHVCRGKSGVPNTKLPKKVR